MRHEGGAPGGPGRVFTELIRDYVKLDFPFGVEGSRGQPHAAGGPTECIVAAQRPLIVESGRLEIVNPPETRADLTQYPGTLTLAFGPITQGGVTFSPIGIYARYVSAGDPAWLGGQRPTLSVLYRADGSSGLGAIRRLPWPAAEAAAA